MAGYVVMPRRVVMARAEPLGRLSVFGADNVPPEEMSERSGGSEIGEGGRIFFVVP